VLGLVGMIILVGLAGEWVFKKTGVPNALFLIGLGVLLGPVLGVISPESMTAAAPLFGTLALLIILFDGGLNLKILKVIREAPFALLYTTVVFCASALAVAAVYRYFFGGGWTIALLLGVILGGIEMFQEQYDSGFQTAAFGNTSSDITMFEAADRPFLVARSDRSPSKGLSRLERLTRLSEVGPAGWAEGINRLLDESSDAPRIRPPS
jgi:hypothetical protein